MSANQISHSSHALLIAALKQRHPLHYALGKHNKQQNISPTRHCDVSAGNKVRKTSKALISSRLYKRLRDKGDSSTSRSLCPKQISRHMFSYSFWREKF